MKLAVMKDLIKNWYSKDLEQKKSWYSPAADSYNKVRPSYPQKIIKRVVELAKLSSEAKILEVGCGPGNATVAFAKLGFSMVCVEPNPDFCRLVRQNCTLYPKVEICNTSFEEWELEADQFDLVLAATSFHWIPPEIAYPKAANALKDNGFLVLLWNKQLQPQYEVYQSLCEVYQLYAPSLAQYEDRQTQENILKDLGKMIIDSGQFKDLVYENYLSEVTYSINDYLMLLNTYSPYLELDSPTRNSLFAGLREKIEQDLGGNIQLSYLSAFHLAQKI